MSGGFRSRAKKSAPGASESLKRTPQGARQRDKAERPRREQTSTTAATPMIKAALRSGVDLARAVSFATLLRVETDKAYANLILPKSLRDNKLHGRDAAFATEITYGTLRAQGIVDAVIADCASRGLDAMAPEVLTALRIGAYQLLFTRVEAHAAVDTTVRLVEATGNDKAKGFVNGIMRTISRTKPEKWIEKLTPRGEIEALAFRHSHPEWIARSFSRVVGLGEVEEVLRADSERPRVHLVARPGEISAEELALSIGGEEGQYSPYAVYMPSGDPGDLDAVQQGLAAVQDEGSQLIARAVVEAPVEGTDSGRWLDLCAGPGGKAALMGALARIDGAHVDAVEVSPHRAKLIEKTVRDLPVTVKVADGRSPGLESGYDRILVDAPCSGLGALRRRPEARWRKQETDIADLSALQFELLSSAFQLLRPGGVLVYSTCSPDLRETREVVDRAVAELGAQEADARTVIPDMGNVGNEQSVQMWPHRHGTDAMFFALLYKPKSAVN
ncbi:MAG: transcription antitermination factor NusB [Corynebacterium sp.]|nr:transcription antitermination factor NusB [Corynebacterium sp.]